jgi:CDP-4-dehydro-6-deoxyglucose reductase
MAMFTRYTGIMHDKQDARFFICGWQQMIDEAEKKILELGYDKKAVHVELYG